VFFDLKRKQTASYNNYRDQVGHTLRVT